MGPAFTGYTEQDLKSRFSWNLPNRFNIGVDCCDRHDPGRLALIHIEGDGHRREVSYGELRDSSNRLANVLQSRGVGVGDRVCVSLPQDPWLAISHLAIYKLGAIAVPMTTLFGPDAFRYRLLDSAAVAMITDQPTSLKVAPVREELPNLLHVIEVDRRWDEFLAASPKFVPRDTDLDDPALLIYTSGTTGDPKGALHAHRVLIGHLPGFELSHEFYGQPGDRFWTPADWAWIGGLYDALFPVLHHGSTIVSYAHSGRFDPELAISMIRRLDIRNAFIPPTALKIMRQHLADEVVRLRLRTVMSGGEPLGEEMLDWGRQAFGVTINEIYGQTEANYLIGNCSLLYPVRPGSMGKTYPGHNVTVLDANGHPTRGIGQIAVREPDPVMFLNYWNQPEATRDRFRNNWMLTGDTAQLDADGYFWFQGRNDDLINSAGYRIGPTEIESCLMRHASVAQAAVVGVPDQIRGEAVKAFIVLKAGYTATPTLTTDIQDFVRVRLAAYQYPRLVEFVSELPLTTTGKVRRTELRKRNQTGRAE
jgi:acetyl-CoA synthetase